MINKSKESTDIPDHEDGNKSSVDSGKTYREIMEEKMSARTGKGVAKRGAKKATKKAAKKATKKAAKKAAK